MPSARGRPLLLGTDPTRLRTAVLERDRTEELTALLERGEAASLAAFLGDNAYLREEAYRRLAVAGELDALARLAVSFAGAVEPELVDVRALCAVRLAGEPDGEQLAELIALLRAAVPRFPYEPSVYLLLGEAYERSALEDGPERARVCYQEAADLSWDGPELERALAGLERLP